jgi:adenosine deaminase CECR1
MTDEYYTAVTTFHLTWPEIVLLGHNSLSYSFAEAPLKEKMMREYNDAVAAFESRYSGANWRARLKEVKPLVSGYALRNWGIR